MVRRILILLAGVLLTISDIYAQEKVQVVDDQGYPLSFVAIRNEEGAPLGNTDIDGYLPELSKADVIYLSHVGFEPLKVRLASVRNNRISMKASNIFLRQVNVNHNKPVIRLRAYFRTYVEDYDELVVYHSGIVDFYINPRRDSEEYRKLAEVKHVKKSYREEYNAAPFTSIGTFSMMEAMKRSPEFEVRNTADPNRQLVLVDGRLVGRLVHDTVNKVYRLSIDVEIAQNRAKSQKVKGGRIITLDAKDMWNFIYGEGEDGYVSMNDFRMRNRTDNSTREVRVNGDIDDWTRNIVQDIYIIESERLTRKEAREKRREKLSVEDYAGLEEYRISHQIPDMDEMLKEQVEAFFAKNR